MLTTSVKDDREAARFLVKGERVTMDVLEFLDTFDVGDAVIKGGNAVDPYGNAGVLASNSQGGTVGALLSFIAVRGLPIIMPIGLEKLIPDVIEASNGWGQRTLDRSMGEKAWLVPVTCGLVVTEIEALGILAGVEARMIAGGGIGGSEGAVVLLLEGSEKDLDKAWKILEGVKGEAPIAGAAAQLHLLREATSHRDQIDHHVSRRRRRLLRHGLLPRTSTSPWSRRCAGTRIKECTVEQGLGAARPDRRRPTG